MRLVNKKADGFSIVEMLMVVLVGTVVMTMFYQVLMMYINSNREIERKHNTLTALTLFDRYIIKQFRLHRNDDDLNRWAKNSSVYNFTAKEKLNGVELIIPVGTPTATSAEWNRLLVAEQMRLSDDTVNNPVIRYEYEVVCVDAIGTTSKQSLIKKESYWDDVLSKNLCLFAKTTNTSTISTGKGRNVRTTTKTTTTNGTCDWSKQTVAIRQTTWTDWKDTLFDGNDGKAHSQHRTTAEFKAMPVTGKCFPEETFVAVDNGDSANKDRFSCKLRNPDRFLENPIGMSFCAWASDENTFKTGRGLMLDLYSYYVPNITTGSIKAEYKRSVLDRQGSAAGLLNLVE